MATEVFTSFDQQCDANGVPYSGCKIYVYDVNSTTPKSLYSDTGLSVSVANPIVTDSAGRHAMTYLAAGSYKIVAKTAAGASIYTRDYVDGRIPIGSGALAIANGGTGATSAGAALTALGGATSATVSDLAADVASLSGALASSEKTHIATGTTAQRPSAPIEGDIRRNTTTGEWEGYNGATWELLKSSADATTTSAIASETAEDTYIRPDRAKYGQYAAKAWAKITWSAGTPTIADSYNVGSITDQGVGDITVTFGTAMSNTSYVIMPFMAYAAGTANISCAVSAQATGSFRLATQSGSSPGASDPLALHVVVYGDIA